MDRRLPALLAATALAVTFLSGGCGRGGKGKTVEIAFVTKALDSEWWQRVKAGAEEAARSHPGVRLAVLAPEHLVRASEIEERYQLHFWDAMIVAAATTLGASTILSEDLQDGQTIEGIVIRNPLL